MIVLTLIKGFFLVVFILVGLLLLTGGASFYLGWKGGKPTLKTEVVKTKAELKKAYANKGNKRIVIDDFNQFIADGLEEEKASASPNQLRKRKRRKKKLNKRRIQKQSRIQNRK